MRWMGWMAAALLAGCAKPAEPPLTDAPIVIGAYEAFRAGAYRVVEQKRDAIHAGIPADHAIVIGCSPQGFSARRLIKIEDRLDLIASPRAQSFPEPARFIYLEGVLFSAYGRRQASDTSDWPTDCDRAPDAAEAQRLDAREQQAMRDGARSVMSAWRKDLKVRYGADYEAQMKRSVKLLVANKMRDDPFFGENSLYD